MSDKGKNACTNTVSDALEEMSWPFPSQKGMCNVCLYLSGTVPWPGKRKQPACMRSCHIHLQRHEMGVQLVSGFFSDCAWQPKKFHI